MSKRPRGRPKGSGGTAATLDPSQVKQLLQVAQRLDGATYRRQLALLFSYELGMRASEISRISVGDVYDDAGSVRETLEVFGSRNRLLPLKSARLRAVLADYFERSLRDTHLESSRPIIESRRSRGMTPASLARLMTSVYRAAGFRSGSSLSGRRTLRMNLDTLGLLPS